LQLFSPIIFDVRGFLAEEYILGLSLRTTVILECLHS
jgi:hypothetical protein